MIDASMQRKKKKFDWQFHLNNLVLNAFASHSFTNQIKNTKKKQFFFYKLPINIYDVTIKTTLFHKFNCIARTNAQSN